MANFREYDIRNALKIARTQRNDIVLCCSSYQPGARVLARVIGFTNGNVKLIVKSEASEFALERMFINSKVVGYSQESNFKFKTKVEDFYKNRLTIQLPHEVEFFYKRAHDRIEAPQGYQVRCGTDRVELPVHDISNGGISLLLNHTELGHFSGDDESFHLDMFEEKFQELLQARLVNVRSLTEERQGKSHRASFEFNDLTAQGHEMVTKLVSRFDNEVQRVS
jgi:hypothetical protein